MVTKEEARFEKHMSRSVLDEIVKLLKLSKVRRHKNAPDHHVDYPFTTRLYGERLVIPQGGCDELPHWDVTITVALWFGVFKIDISSRQHQNGCYCGEGDLELKCDAADPTFLEDVVRHYYEVQKQGPPPQ